MKPIVVTGRIIQPNETVKKLNPHLFQAEPDGVGRLGRVAREPGQNKPLVSRPQAQPRRQGSVAVVCQIVSLRNRVCDADGSAAGGNKALQDSIARSLLIDDASETIRFEYAQCHTSGPEGTIVRIAWI